SDVVVVATAHEHLGAVVTAVVERGAATVSRAVLEAAARAELAPTHRPRRWLAVDALPRTSSGKPARAAISSAVAAGRLPTEPLPWRRRSRSQRGVPPSPRLGGVCARSPSTSWPSEW